MSLLAPPVLPLPHTAPHTRVQHIFYLAPFIKRVFEEFLVAHPGSDLLERDAFVQTLSRIYLAGLCFTPTFWKEIEDLPLPANKQELVDLLELLRKGRGKLRGLRPWGYFRNAWWILTRDRLPSRKAMWRQPIDFNESEAETMVRIRLVRLVMRVVEAQINPPPRPAPPAPTKKRSAPAARVIRHKKTLL